jgi:glutamine amidotransferase
MNPARIAVLDYGIGNIHSVAKALRAVGTEPQITSDPDAVRQADMLVVPGVGAFADCLGCLLSRQLDGPVLEFIRSGRPFLGICVGMQMLFAESREFGSHRGLGVIEGTVERLREAEGIKVPHIGWNALQPSRPWSGSVLDGCASGAMVYFVHSFSVAPARGEDWLAEANYGPNRICAAIQKDNVMGTQFHPEKSGDIGLGILRKFVNPR